MKLTNPHCKRKLLRNLRNRSWTDILATTRSNTQRSVAKGMGQIKTKHWHLKGLLTV